MNIYTNRQQILCDTLTPISGFLSLRDVYANVSLFESSDYSSKVNAHSFIGVNPIVTIQVSNKTAEVRVRGKLVLTKVIQNELDLSQIIDEYEFTNKEESHHNGFFGVIGYHAVALFEDIELRQSVAELPDVFLAAYEFVLVFDHFHNQLTILNNSFKENENRLASIIVSLNRSAAPSGNFKKSNNFSSSDTDDTFKEKVKLAKEHILRGDVFQLVLSRQFSQGFSGDDFEFYRQLRTLNPSPYMFYFDLDKAKLIGASPEAQIKIENNIAEIHPIAGTVRKTEQVDENNLRIEELKADKKENAEHIMLVDLARNDLNRNCSQVKVEKLKEVQTFSHVIHMVSKVTARVGDVSSLSIFGGCFPAGTLSGAPKYRAMELIDQYETTRRNYYGGAIGLLAANGDVNMAIVIRTALSYKGNLIYQAGAGIVKDSTPEGECQEVYNKISAVETAIQNANDL